jgi:predicted RNA-binding protein (virulence factor B family)
VIINGAIKGSLFPDERFGRFEVGDVKDAFVKAIRPEDKKVAVTLRPSGYKAALGLRDVVLKALRDNNGFVPLTDSSSPEEIHRWFGMSKSAFKKLIGTMYREGDITLESHGIRKAGSR